MVDESGRGGAGAPRQAGLDREGAPSPGAAARTGAARPGRVGGPARGPEARLAGSESEARIGAKELVSALAEEEAELLEVSYRRIRIGAQRTLWGSCSPGGTLSFNWRLVLASFSVLDYVVVHELCHLRFLDHSQRFWRLVEARRPHWREQRDWLREHGPELLAFRPSE